jgi:hypothetical protein
VALPHARLDELMSPQVALACQRFCCILKSVDADFRWNSHNLEHIGVHGIDRGEAEYVVRHVRSPFPRPIGDE